MERLLDVKQLSRMIGLKPKTINNRLCKGTFPLKPVKIDGENGKNLWRESEADEYIKSLDHHG